VGRLLLCRGQRQEDSLQRDTETSPAVQVNPDAELAAHANSARSFIPTT
jgi:hypothetical protein